MNSNIINTCDIIFSVKFIFAPHTCNHFICTLHTLKDVLQSQRGDYPTVITEFNPHKLRFSKVSRDRILKLSEMDTETYEYLVNHYYFKKR